MKALILKINSLDGIARERVIVGLISANVSIWTHVVLSLPILNSF